MKNTALLKTFVFYCAIANVWLGSTNAQTSITPEQAEFFETTIRPVLIDSCYECHSTKMGQKKGGLSLDSKFGLRAGGNSGPGVVPGNLEQSWLWLAVSHSEPDYEMPPKSKLPDYAIADIKKWIEMGAPDPREGEKKVSTEIDIETGREFWSFQTPTRQTVPVVAETKWASTEIDRYIKAALDKQKLEPVELAGSHSILRRLSYDLIGMPPTLAFSQKFQQSWQTDPNRTIETTVDKLLASRQFGERWGKHWMDIARYAESNGSSSNQTFPHAWRYRDYIIDSVNADKPVNRFIQEQLAGDLLPFETDTQRQNQLIATGFLAIGPKPLREKSNRQFLMDTIDEQIDTTSKALLGLTVSCARCHDHKFDPIPTSDYYSLAGIFMSSTTNYGTAGNSGRYNSSGLIQLPIGDPSKATYNDQELAEMRKQLVQLQAELKQFHNEKRTRMKGNGPTMKDVGKRGSAKRLRERQSKLEEAIASVTSNGTMKAFAMGMAEKTNPIDANILVRGEIDSPAQVVPRGFLQVLNHAPTTIKDDASGRLELAKWVTSSNNPLTARVYVNRVWEKLFGAGLVTTVDNFGTTGEAPSHPELLDHLAIQFIEQGWSLKKLVRSILLTRTYQLSSEYSSENYSIDPENKYLWRATPRRLDAESFRDTILSISGQLKLANPHRSPVTEYGLEELGRKGSPDVFANFPLYRSVYLPPVRNAMNEFIKVFDGADPSVVTAKREVSSGAEQSLFLLNSPFILGQANHFSNRLQEKSNQLGDQLRHAFLLAYGRPATKAEYDSAIKFHHQYLPTVEDSLSKEIVEKKFLTLFCQSLLCSAEVRYLR